MLENYDLLTLVVDETIDDGVIIETDGEAIAQRITRPPTSDGVVKVELTEQGLLNAYQMAKEMAKDRFLKAAF